MSSMIKNGSTTTSQIVQGVVVFSAQSPVELAEIVIPAPGKHDVIVRILACGVCHTDYTYQQGGITDEYPFLLGHEASGIVETIGEDVTHVRVGDFVILNWRAICGECRACKRGETWNCFNTFNAENPMTLTDGTVLTPALGIGAFAEKTLVNERQCTRVDADCDPAVACLLGCGVMAGLGAALNTGEVSRGDSVAVIGCGGVGNAAIAGAYLAGATIIIAIDHDEKKLAMAQEFGATHTICNKDMTDEQLLDAIAAICPHGTRVAIDAVGRPETWKQAFYVRDLAGTVVLVGVPTPDMQLTMPLLDFFSHGGSLKSSWYGDCLPERDFPVLIDLYRQNRLPLDKFVSEKITISDINSAFDTLKTGSVLRSVVIMDS